MNGKIRDKDLHSLNSSRNVRMVTKSRSLYSSRQIAFVENTENEKNIFVWNSEGRGHFGTDIINGRIILKMDPREACCVDMKWVKMAQIEFSNSYFQAVIHIDTYTKTV
jgi:hypothetical protein